MGINENYPMFRATHVVRTRNGRFLAHWMQVAPGRYANEWSIYNANGSPVLQLWTDRDVEEMQAVLVALPEVA